MKQKTLAFVLIALLAVSLFLLVGRHLVISPIQEKIQSQTQQTETMKKQLQTLNQQIEKARKDTTETPKTLQLLPSGSEHEILQSLVSAASATGFLIESLSLQPTFQRKPKPEDSSESAATPILQEGVLPQVDENGMPIGLRTDDDESGPVVEVVPVRVQGKGSLRSWGMFLRQVRQSVPLFGFRELALEYTTPDPKGAFEIVVPLKSAVQATIGLSQPLTGGKRNGQ